MKLVLGSDRAGFPLRQALEAHLKEAGYELEILGPETEEEAVPFYRIAPKAAGMIQSGAAERGVLICGTGMGMAQVANKYKGVRAACVESEYSARMARVINDSNLLCMGGWIVAPAMACVMADAFLNARFVEGVEEWRKQWLSDAKTAFAALEDEIFASEHQEGDLS
ncbi:MAG: RpiB/LacA/LacB family sugar-phosphate isomerase [Clostridiales bacterium]|nr:RpiB/LacA/LacB family sugar-phosphate isomerase [Clostridiales bacterium]